MKPGPSVVGLFCWSGFFVGKGTGYFSATRFSARQLAFQHGHSLFSTVTRFSARSFAFQHGHSLFSTVIRTGGNDGTQKTGPSHKSIAIRRNELREKPRPATVEFILKIPCNWNQGKIG
jgi:hypothetical protein